MQKPSDQRISSIIDQLTAAKALAEKDIRCRMLVYLLDLAIVDAEEERDLQRLREPDVDLR